VDIYQRLGLDLDAGLFTYKAGAEFVDERTGQSAVYDFEDSLPGGVPYAYQVERSTFDDELLKCAVRAGAGTRLGQRVTDVRFDNASVEVSVGETTLRARYCVDATGQDAFLARRGRSIEAYPGFGKAAVFCHFTGVSAEVQRALFPRGHVKVVMLPDGWAWLIPLRGDKVSCGVVSRGTGITGSLLEKFIASSALVQSIAQGSTRTEPRVIRNFSFRNRVSRGARWVCVGDAACFLDPVFSSGVSLAVLGAERMSQLLSPALREGREQDAELMGPLGATMEVAYNSIGALVHSF
jgi:flavin-dependent dehydrogenase